MAVQTRKDCLYGIQYFEGLMLLSPTRLKPGVNETTSGKSLITVVDDACAKVGNLGPAVTDNFGKE